MKNLWKKGVLRWRRENPSIALTKENFAPILEQALTYFEKNNVISGFRACGLYPWNPNALDFTKCSGKNNSSRNGPVESIKSPSERNTLCFSDFKNIIGEERLRKFEFMEDLGGNADLEIIYRIYKKFKESNDEYCTNEEEKNQDSKKSNELMDETRGDVRRSSEITEQIDKKFNNPNVDIIKEVENRNTENTPDCETYIDSDQKNINNTANYPDYQSVNSTINITNDDPTESVQTFHIEDIPDVFEFEDEYGKISTANNSPSVNSKSDEFPVLLKKTPIIKNYVQWFPTPERKGTKRTDRISFALTSQEWLQDNE